MAQSKEAFGRQNNRDSYHEWQQWRRQQDSQQQPLQQQALGNEPPPGLRRQQPESSTPAVNDHFAAAANQPSYAQQQATYTRQTEPVAMAAMTQKTTDDQPGADPDGDPKKQYPNLPLSTDKGRVMDVSFDVTGSDGLTHNRTAKVYVPNEVADKMQENQAAGRDALDGVNVMMGFHGHGGNAENTLDGMDMAGIANDSGSILISPQGLGENDPDAPIGPNNESRWDLDGSNDPEFFKQLIPAAGSRISREYGVDADMEGKEIDLVGMSMGANAARECAANPEKCLPEGNSVGTVISVTASGDVSRDGPPTQIGGTQLYVFGMQDEKAAEKILGNENTRKAYLDSLTREEKRDFHDAEDKTAYALEHRGENDKIGELMKDDYMGTVQAAAAAQGVTLTREDIEKAATPIYKPILDDRGKPVLDDKNQPTYDTNTVLGTRYNIDVEQDGNKFKAEINMVEDMNHDWPDTGPSRLPKEIKNAIKDDPDLEARWRDTLTDEQKGEYDGLGRKDQLDYAVNNQGPVDPETGDTMLKDAVDKRNEEKTGFDLGKRAAETIKQDNQPAGTEPGLDQKPTPQDPQQSDPSQDGGNRGDQRPSRDDENGGWAARRQQGPGLG